MRQGQSATHNAMTENVYGNKSHLWFVNTILIAENSIVHETDKKRLSKKDSNVKVKYLGGALVEDMFYDSVPLMRRKKPSALILHVGTNNTVSDSSKVILKKIKLLISRLFQSEQEMLHILIIAVRRIIHVLTIKDSQTLMFTTIAFQKRRKFGYYYRFLSFCFLEEKPLGFTGTLYAVLIPCAAIDFKK